ncbi:hypothetical protein [Compostibacter hankyongensis]|uniref:Outer membrane protein beta-barrel domain-containing protein n=1 Tax=Compostibacter hankyongensis TaxID=1007089 RepID=A0ABP8FFS2_9BACT
MKKRICRTLIAVSALLLTGHELKAQQNLGDKGAFYFSWGYNKEWYTHSNIHISQPSLGNHYVFKNTIAVDKPGWNGHFFQEALTIPQYNYRIGYFFKKNWAVELNFDHTKYVVAPRQLLHVSGTMNHKPVNEYVVNTPDILQYQLNNGANFFLFNLVRRLQLPYVNYKNLNAALLLKGGVGFMYPHVQNTIYDKNNDRGFQFGGLDIGTEAALRLTFFRHVYLEYCNKLVYTNYWGLKIYEGKARQAFGTYEMILNLGGTFPIGGGHRHG